MRTYMTRRLLLFIPTAFGVSIVIFIMLHTIPGDAATALLLGDARDQSFATEEDFARVREKYGLDGSLPEQYGSWLLGILQGDLGKSWNNWLPVSERVGKPILVSLELGVMAVGLACVLGVTLGVIAAVRRDGWIDYAFRSISMGLQAMPGFWIALMVIVFLVSVFDWVPSVTYKHLWDDPIGNLSILWIPALIVGSRSTAEILRMTRSSVLEVLHEDYVRTAHSKGLTARRVLSRHVLRNALLPVTTLAGFEVVFAMSGQIIIERIFSLPGIGNLFISSVGARDYPLIQAIVMFIAFVVLLANLVVDLLYGWLDPRIRYT